MGVASKGRAPQPVTARRDATVPEYLADLHSEPSNCHLKSVQYSS